MKKKIRGKGKGIKAETKDARREWMSQTWERGALNYHRSKEYKKMERPENRDDLLAYHAEFPDAEMGDVYRVLKGLPSLASAELARKMALHQWTLMNLKKSKSNKGNQESELVITKRGASTKIQMDGEVFYKVDGDDETITEAQARELELSHSFIGKAD